jgi:hypothetical protein
MAVRVVAQRKPLQYTAGNRVRCIATEKRGRLARRVVKAIEGKFVKLSGCCYKLVENLALLE